MQKQHTSYIYWTNFHHSAKEQKYRQNLIQEYLDLYLLCTWDYACILICLRDALDNSGYKHKLKYKANLDTVSNKKQQKRNIIWINPLYSKNVKTNKGKIFLNLIKKHFPPHHKFHKLFNKNTVKISYTCTWNIKTIINSQNAKILFPEKSTEQRTFNCWKKVNCPLEQKCLTTNIVYKAKVASRNQNYQEKLYFGSCETTFKKRFSNHKKSFNLNEYKDQTELSNEIWQIKNSSHHPKVTWEIVKTIRTIYVKYVTHTIYSFYYSYHSFILYSYSVNIYVLAKTLRTDSNK